MARRELPLIDAEFAGGDLCIPDTLDPAKVTGKIVLCRRGANGRADKSHAVFKAGGAGMILYNTTDDDNLFTDNHWVPTVHIDFTPGVEGQGVTSPRPNKPTAKITDTGQEDRHQLRPSMTIFSSRGPNPSAGDIIKPDITAPGLQILAGASPFADLPRISGATPGGELFQSIAGTSMSSPHIAGFYALLRQAHPDWTRGDGEVGDHDHRRHDVADNDRSTPGRRRSAMGSGQLDPGKVKDKGSAFNPGLVYDAGFNDYLGFLCGADRRSSLTRRRRVHLVPRLLDRSERPQLPVDRRRRSRRYADGHPNRHERRRPDREVEGQGSRPRRVRRRRRRRARSLSRQA